MINRKIYRVLFKFATASVFILAGIISPRMENFVDEKLGIFSFMLPLYFILSAVVDMLKDKKMRILYRTRLLFFYMSAFVLANFFVFLIQRGTDEDSFLDLAYRNNYGGYLITLFHYLNFKINRNIVLVFSGFVLFFSIFVFFGRLMGSFVRWIKYYFSKEGKEERSEKNLKKLRAKKMKKTLKEKQKEMRKLSGLKKKRNKVNMASDLDDKTELSEIEKDTPDVVESAESFIEELSAADTAENEKEVNFIEASHVEEEKISDQDSIFFAEKSSVETRQEQEEDEKRTYEEELDSIIEELEEKESATDISSTEMKESAKDKFLEGKEKCYEAAYEILEKDRGMSVVKLQNRLEVGYKKAKEIYTEIIEELDRDDTSI